MKVVRFLFMLSILNCLAVAFAAEYVWDGGAGDGKWSSAANWTLDGVPGKDDDVVFAASSGSATVDEDFGGEVMNLTLQEGYSGTITLGRQLIVAKTLKQESGGFACGDHDLHLGPKSRTVNQYLYPAKLELVGGTFTAPSGLLRVYSKDASGSATIKGCSFNANGGAPLVRCGTVLSLPNDGAVNLELLGKVTPESVTHFPLFGYDSFGWQRGYDAANWNVTLCEDASRPRGVPFVQHVADDKTIYFNWKYKTGLCLHIR